MKFTREHVQEKVDHYSGLIRQIGINLEEIAVEEKKFSQMLAITVMTTEKGKIYIDPTYNYPADIVNLDMTVLHELGHRAVESIRPTYNEDVIKGYIGPSKFLGRTRLLFSRKVHDFYSMIEGAAECFSLDVFPSSIFLSSESEQHRNVRRMWHLFKGNGSSYSLGRGYLFFHFIYHGGGLQGLTEYIRNFSPSEVPSREELENPALYWGKFKRLVNSDSIIIPTAH